MTSSFPQVCGNSSIVERERAMVGFLAVVAVLCGLMLLGYYLFSRVRLCDSRYPPIREVLARPSAQYDLRDIAATGLFFKLFIRLGFSPRPFLYADLCACAGKGEGQERNGSWNVNNFICGQILCIQSAIILRT